MEDGLRLNTTANGYSEMRAESVSRSLSKRVAGPLLKQMKIMSSFDDMKPFLIKNPDYLNDSVGGERSRFSGPRNSLSGIVGGRR